MDEKKPTAYKWTPPRSGVFHEIYCNYAHASWTLSDVRLTLGQLIPNEEGVFVIEQRGAVTFAWDQAKYLRDRLVELIASYESVNGEIPRIKLPPDPTVKPKED